jgi:hypothetical protein
MWAMEELAALMPEYSDKPVDVSTDESWEILDESAAEAIHISDEEATKKFSEGNFEWSDDLSLKDRNITSMTLAHVLQGVGAEWMQCANTALILFRLTQEQKEKAGRDRFEMFKNTANRITLKDFVESNRVWSLKYSISDTWSDAVVMRDCFLSSMDALREIKPGVWYVASPEVVMH